MRELNGLVRFGLITMSNGYDIQATENGALMARYYIGFETMKIFTQVSICMAFYLLIIISVFNICEKLIKYNLFVYENHTWYTPPFI